MRKTLQQTLVGRLITLTQGAEVRETLSASVDEDPVKLDTKDGNDQTKNISITTL